MDVLFDDIILNGKPPKCFLSVFSKRQMFNNIGTKVIQINNTELPFLFVKLAKSKKLPCPGFHSASSWLDWSNSHVQAMPSPYNTEPHVLIYHYLFTII